MSTDFDLAEHKHHVDQYYKVPRRSPGDSNHKCCVWQGQPTTQEKDTSLMCLSLQDGGHHDPTTCLKHETIR